jgi:hypothetical protein
MIRVLAIVWVSNVDILVATSEGSARVQAYRDFALIAWQTKPFAA